MIISVGAALCAMQVAATNASKETHPDVKTEWLKEYERAKTRALRLVGLVEVIRF